MLLLPSFNLPAYISLSLVVFSTNHMDEPFAEKADTWHACGFFCCSQVSPPHRAARLGREIRHQACVLHRGVSVERAFDGDAIAVDNKHAQDALVGLQLLECLVDRAAVGHVRR